MKTSSSGAQRDSSRPSVVRIALSGVSFLGAAFLAFLVYKSIAILASGLYYQSMVIAIPWACLNVVSFALVGTGLLCRRPRLTATGGCILVLSSIIMGFIASRYRGRETHDAPKQAVLEERTECVACRERPPWRSVNRHGCRNTGPRNATEGAPHSPADQDSAELQANTDLDS